MTIRDQVARAIKPEWFGESGKALSNYPDQDSTYQELARKQATAAINAFLAAAAGEGWHMRPDEATDGMIDGVTEPGGIEDYYRAMLADPTAQFERDK